MIYRPILNYFFYRKDNMSGIIWRSAKKGGPVQVHHNNKEKCIILNKMCSAMVLTAKYQRLLAKVFLVTSFLEFAVMLT